MYDKIQVLDFSAEVWSGDKPCLEMHVSDGSVNPSIIIRDRITLDKLTDLLVRAGFGTKPE